LIHHSSRWNVVFAGFKEQRGLGRFSRRGVVRVRPALGVEVLVPNLRVVQRASRQKQNAKGTHPTTEPIAAYKPDDLYR